MNSDARRPLKSRSATWAIRAAAGLARMGVSPNTISAGSMLMALAGALAMIAAGHQWLPPWIGWGAGAAFIQLRLICNLMDGMVAIEGGRKSATGGIWNEAPDRFADTLLLLGAGIACHTPWAGAAASWAAVMTAYIRELGADLDRTHDFCGPFAKPQRMAVLTAAVLAQLLQSLWPQASMLLPWTLWIIAAGSLFTALRRWLRLSRRLKNSASS